MCDLQSDVNSPGQQQGSPIGAMQLSGGCHDELSGDNLSGVQRNGPLDDPAWPYDAEDLEVRKPTFHFFFAPPYGSVANAA